MGKHHRIYKRPRNGGKIRVTARQVDKLVRRRNRRLNSRDYKDLKRMRVIESSPKDAIWALKQYSDDVLLGPVDYRKVGRGKRVYVRVEGEDKYYYYCSISYIPRVLNNRDVNDAIVRAYYIRQWRVTKKMLVAMPYGINVDLA